MAQDALINTATEAFAEPHLKEMIDAGVFYGRMRTKTNPKMKQYILTNRNGIEIINLEKTSELLDSALNFINDKVKARTPLMIVGTQPSASESVRALAQELEMPSVITRWLGGTLTNFKVISKRVEYYKKLKVDWQNEAFRNKYVKKERIMIEKELEKLEAEMSSLENLGPRPECLIVIDPNIHMAAVKEANKLGIPVVALISTDVNPDMIDYPVPGNTKARASVQWFLEKVGATIRKAKAEMPPLAETPNNNENR